MQEYLAGCGVQWDFRRSLCLRHVILIWSRIVTLKIEKGSRCAASLRGVSNELEGYANHSNFASSFVLVLRE